MIAAAVHHHDTYSRATTLKLFALVAVIGIVWILGSKAVRSVRNNRRRPHTLAATRTDRRAVGSLSPQPAQWRRSSPVARSGAIRRPEPLGGPRPRTKEHARSSAGDGRGHPGVFVPPLRDPDWYVDIDGIRYGGWNR